MAYKVILNPFEGTLQLVTASSGTSGVFGIPPTTPMAIARWVDTDATTIENSPGTLVQDSGAIEAQAFITQRNVSGTVTVNATETWIAPALTLEPGANVIIQPGGELIIL